MIQVGDMVKIKDWNQLVAENRLVGSTIYMHDGPTFVRRMRHLCGKFALVTGVADRGFRLAFSPDVPDTCWYYTEDMFIKVGKHGTSA